MKNRNAQIQKNPVRPFVQRIRAQKLIRPRTIPPEPLPKRPEAFARPIKNDRVRVNPDSPKPWKMRKKSLGMPPLPQGSIQKKRILREWPQIPHNLLNHDRRMNYFHRTL
jgi:hypothetical protein